MKINFENIVNNAISTLVTAIVVGACAIVWVNASSFTERLSQSEQKQKATIEVVDQSVEDLANKLNITNEKLDLIMAKLKVEFRNKSELIEGEYKDSALNLPPKENLPNLIPPPNPPIPLAEEFDNSKQYNIQQQIEKREYKK